MMALRDLCLDGFEVIDRQPQRGEAARCGTDGPDGCLAFDLDEWDAREAFVGGAPAQEWLISDAIPRGVAGIVAAAGDTGKSFSLLELALRVTEGPKGPGSFGLPAYEEPIFGGRVQSHGAAVFITAEDSRGSVHRRIRALDPDGQRQAGRRYPLYVVPLPDAGGPFPIVTEERGQLAATAQFHELRKRLLAIPDLALVVIDPLQTFALADINADPKAAALTMSLLNTRASETRATVLVAHHVRKEKEPPRNGQEARNLIRGSSALVDQSRVAIVLWTPDDKHCRQVCREMGVDYAPNAVVLGAVVKSNDGASRREWTLLRGADGVLRDVTLDLVRGSTSKAELAEHLIAAIAAAADAGRPFTKTGQGGLYTRRAELGDELRGVSRHRLEGTAQELEEAGRIVTTLAGGTSVKWLDVPEGPFARGDGAFAAGFGGRKAERKAC